MTRGRVRDARADLQIDLRDAPSSGEAAPSDRTDARPTGAGIVLRGRSLAVALAAVLALGLLAGVAIGRASQGDAPASTPVVGDERRVAAGESADPAGDLAAVTAVLDAAGRGIVRVEGARTGAAPTTGLGVVLGDGGVIATVARIVEGASRVDVTLPDARTIVATVAGIDLESDLALLRVDGGDLQSLAFADGSELDVGVTLLVPGRAGAPGRVAAGVGPLVALDGTARRTDGSTRTDLLRVGVPSAASDEGAPVLDAAGRVVGIVVDAGGDDAATTVAVPGWDARSILARLTGAVG